MRISKNWAYPCIKLLEGSRRHPNLIECINKYTKNSLEAGQKETPFSVNQPYGIEC